MGASLKIGSDLFKKELNLIKDTDLRNHIINILDNCIHYDNFLKPSSSTGKYHPYFDNSDYGNTNHTKAVVKLCNVLLTSRTDLLLMYHDIVYASAILHDMWKYDGRSSHTNKSHAELSYLAINQYIKDFNLDNPLLDNVAKCVRYHMGHWSFQDNEWIMHLNQLDINFRDCVLILHYADMIASRKFYDIKEYYL